MTVEHQLADDVLALDHARSQAIDNLRATGAAPVELPEDYQLRGEFGGSSVNLDLDVFRGGPFAWARVTRMRSERVQVLNVVAVPKVEVEAPCFGAELLGFARGMHLVVLDAWPSELHAPAVAQKLDSARSNIQAEWELEAIPEWGREVFSEHCVVVRPGARAAAPARRFTAPFIDVFSAYTSTRHPVPADPDTHVARRKKWLQVQGEEEPAGDFLARIAGHEWVERFTFDVLYPKWLYDGDADPPWLQ
jgi:hypothetical protein